MMTNPNPSQPSNHTTGPFAAYEAWTSGVVLPTRHSLETTLIYTGMPATHAYVLRWIRAAFYAGYRCAQERYRSNH